MKKFLIFCLAVTLILLCSAYLLGGVILGRLSDELISRLPPLGSRIGVEVIEPSYERVRLTSLRTASWEGISARLNLIANKTLAGSEAQYLFTARRLNATLMDFTFKRVLLELQEFSVLPTDAGRPVAVDSVPLPEEIVPGRLSGDYIRAIAIAQDRSDPRESLSWFLDELLSLVRTGETLMPIDVKGTLAFSLGGAARTAGLQTERSGDGWRLALVRSDVKQVSDYFDEELTDAEVDLVARFPLRASTLLRIKEQAESTARQARESDPSVPEDAYRHVLWSYLLTGTYGAGFAQQVTDAHEEGALDNTAAESAMDYNNNSVGRFYAQRDVPEDEILVRVKTDPKVLRESG